MVAGRIGKRSVGFGGKKVVDEQPHAFLGASVHVCLGNDLLDRSTGDQVGGTRVAQDRPSHLEEFGTGDTVAQRLERGSRQDYVDAGRRFRRVGQEASHGNFKTEWCVRSGST